MAYNNKLLAVCTAVSFAFVLLILSSGSSLQAPDWAASQASPASHDTNNVAFATFLSGDTSKHKEDVETSDDLSQDGYFVGARVLGYQLMHSQSVGANRTIPFLVVCTEDVSSRKRERLKKDGATVIVVDKLTSDVATPATPRWTDMLSKLRLFQLTDYSKICYMDADILVTGPLTGVFDDKAAQMQKTLTKGGHFGTGSTSPPSTYLFAAHIDYGTYNHPFPPTPGWGGLNAGFFVLSPSDALFEYYMSFMNDPAIFAEGDMEQSLLKQVHREDGNMPWQHLWYGWNLNYPRYKDYQKGARSFHAKYWLDDSSHSPELKAMWQLQRIEMEAFYRGRDSVQSE